MGCYPDRGVDRYVGSLALCVGGGTIARQHGQRWHFIVDTYAQCSSRRRSLALYDYVRVGRQRCRRGGGLVFFGCGCSLCVLTCCEQDAGGCHAAPRSALVWCVAGRLSLVPGSVCRGAPAARCHQLQLSALHSHATTVADRDRGEAGSSMRPARMLGQGGTCVTLGDSSRGCRGFPLPSLLRRCCVFCLRRAACLVLLQLVACRAVL